MFYLVDKPLSLSSFDIIRRLRKILNTRKIWHTGTLDPLATGCLLIATENSTKLIPLLEKLEKTYLFTVRIDGTTESLDLWSEILHHDMCGFLEKSPGELLHFLESQTEQIPPKYSALKIAGVPAYKRARRGEDIEFKARPIRITHVEIVRFSPPEFEIRLRISSGGYIRSLAWEIGKFFGLSGGYITALRREAIHVPGRDVSISDARTLEIFDPESSISYEDLFRTYPFREVSESIYNNIQNGKDLPWDMLDEIYNIWQKIFIKYNDSPISLIEYQGNGFQIIRNNI